VSVSSLVMGQTLLTPEGYRYVVSKSTNKAYLYGYKFITYDNIVIECTKNQIFFTRDNEQIRGNKVRHDTWLKSKNDSKRIKEVIMSTNPYGSFTGINVSSLGGIFYLSSGILTSYRP